MQVTLEQWQALVAVVDAGGYAKAAELLGKSQSAVSYAIQKLEGSLNVRVFKLSGRRATLTEAGQTLYRHAKRLLAQAEQTEELAQQFSQGYEAQIRLAMDAIFPSAWMLEVLALFAEQHPHTRIELLETVLSGSDEAVLKRQVDLSISGRVPPGFLGEKLMDVRFIACAHPDHPLHQMNRTLSLEDLRQHRQLVVRDSGSRSVDSGWLGAEQRWTVSDIGTSVLAACKGIGYAWYPVTRIQQALDDGLLKPLPLGNSTERSVELYLILTDGELARPGVCKLASMIHQKVHGH
ncbi:LysR family transcriptional regulator [Marinobacterium sediminicola]|uniref:DNA-binding transcriptional regulator, LysR family n=1 Tax=Marinobacterium sediminicola TaxID=518898 RepID=A0ABY1S0M6_9GAMM|nr:LysR family transcriptional regulator [Marinobacterium sediminicola]ULG68364.1 LysR family transcriptional regulator [Marinobacterium sediminicola]SMR74757.1 DNA-binding transcriptional regulator, LysR family [Marinobacterium sediminicola]